MPWQDPDTKRRKSWLLPQPFEARSCFSTAHNNAHCGKGLALCRHTHAGQGKTSLCEILCACSRLCDMCSCLLGRANAWSASAARGGAVVQAPMCWMRRSAACMTPSVCFSRRCRTPGSSTEAASQRCRWPRYCAHAFRNAQHEYALYPALSLSCGSSCRC